MVIIDSGSNGQKKSDNENTCRIKNNMVKEKRLQLHLQEVIGCCIILSKLWIANTYLIVALFFNSEKIRKRLFVFNKQSY